MGNSMFCSLTRPSKPTTAHLIDTQGELQRVESRTTAAELMLEAPGSIVCPVEELFKARGIWALRADEELQAGKFYMLFPAKRVYGKVSVAEMELIHAVCQRKGKKAAAVGAPKVFPDEEDKQEEISNKFLREDHFDITGVSLGRLNSCKQWRPTPEPILEAS